MRVATGSTGVLRALCAWILFALPARTTACGPIDRTAEIRVNDYRITAEVAVAEHEKNCGLSFRDHLPENHGMLFVYFSDRRMAFWMKDTRIPLSIAFIDRSGVILNVLEMKPMDTNTVYRSSGPARYALEMPAAWFTEHQVNAGDPVAIDLPGISD